MGSNFTYGTIDPVTIIGLYLLTGIILFGMASVAGTIVAYSAAGLVLTRLGIGIARILKAARP